jgi:dihydrofolate synthase/folylpolyglutamate synthase
MAAVLIREEAFSQTAEYIADAAMKAGINARICDSVEEALRAIGSLSQLPARVLICGSLYLAGAVLEDNAGA